MNIQDVLGNPSLLETCQIEALGQLVEQGVYHEQIKANPDKFAAKVIEVAQMFVEVKKELDAA